MIRHVALFRFADNVSEQEISAMMGGFLALYGQIEGLLHMAAGSNVSPEHLDQGFRHGIIADFTDATAFDAYLKHPAHSALAEQVINALPNGLSSDVIAFDLALPTRSR